MGQAEVLQFLQEQKRKNPDQWFKATEIKDALLERGCTNGQVKNVYNNLFRLMVFKQINWRGVGAWKHYKIFQAKKGL